MSSTERSACASFFGLSFTGWSTTAAVSVVLASSAAGATSGTGALRRPKSDTTFVAVGSSSITSTSVSSTATSTIAASATSTSTTSTASSCTGTSVTSATTSATTSASSVSMAASSASVGWKISSSDMSMTVPPVFTMSSAWRTAASTSVCTSWSYAVTEGWCGFTTGMGPVVGARFTSVSGSS